MPGEAPPTLRSLAEQELSSSSLSCFSSSSISSLLFLQPLIDAKNAAPDRTGNVIRITHCKGLSVSSFRRHYILGVEKKYYF